MVLCVAPLRITNTYLWTACTSYKGPSPHRDDRATAQRTDSQRGCVGWIQWTRNLVLDERSSREHVLLHILFIDCMIGAGSHESVKDKKNGISCFLQKACNVNK